MPSPQQPQKEMGAVHRNNKVLSESTSSQRPVTLEELVLQITPENRYREIDWGPDVGKEIVEW
jgi:antitoxin component of MazEF toxin-antitoxin module